MLKRLVCVLVTLGSVVLAGTAASDVPQSISQVVNGDNNLNVALNLGTINYYSVYKIGSLAESVGELRLG